MLKKILFVYALFMVCLSAPRLLTCGKTKKPLRSAAVSPKSQPAPLNLQPTAPLGLTPTAQEPPTSKPNSPTKSRQKQFKKLSNKAKSIKLDDPKLQQFYAKHGITKQEGQPIDAADAIKSVQNEIQSYQNELHSTSKKLQSTQQSLSESLKNHTDEDFPTLEELREYAGNLKTLYKEINAAESLIKATGQTAGSLHEQLEEKKTEVQLINELMDTLTPEEKLQLISINNLEKVQIILPRKIKAAQQDLNKMQALDNSPTDPNPRSH